MELPSWAVPVSVLATIVGTTWAIAKDALGARRWLVDAWQRFVAFVRNTRHLDEARARVVVLETELIEVQAALDSARATIAELEGENAAIEARKEHEPKRRRKLLLFRVYWSASEVPSIDPKHVPYCPKCYERGRESVLEHSSSPRVPKEENWITAVVQRQVPGHWLYCAHESHMLMPFQTQLSNWEWDNATTSSEVREKTAV